MASHTDGRSYTTNYTIDYAGRLTGIDYPHDTDVSISYDDAGRKTSMTDATGTSGWTYDNANRCTQIAQPNGTVSYTFDNANRRTQATISGTGNWNWTYDNASRLTSLSNPNSETTSFTLDNAGRCTRTDFANTTYSLTTFDTANRPTEIQTKNSGGTQLSDIQYAYDGVNVTSRTDTDGTVTSFGYDNSNQLTSEVRDNSHSTGYTIAHTYDGNQNRLTKVLNSVTDTYSYDSHDKLTSTSSKSFYYDSNGNCTSVVVGGNTTSLTWNDDNRCTGITYPSTATNSFVYNGDGLRVSKTDSGGTSAVITDGTSPASPVLKDARAVYTPGISERASGTSKTYHTDALGSTRGITDGSQNVTDTVLFDAFGMTVSRTGSTATPFGFVGAQQYQSDADSGLQLLGHRMYDPSVGRFISSDPAKDGSNWYAYCGNLPTGRSDPQGLHFLGDLWYWATHGGRWPTPPAIIPPSDKAIDLVAKKIAERAGDVSQPMIDDPRRPIPAVQAPEPEAPPYRWSPPKSVEQRLAEVEKELGDLKGRGGGGGGSGGGSAAPMIILTGADVLREGMRAEGPWRRTVGRMEATMSEDPVNFEIPQHPHW